MLKAQLKNDCVIRKRSPMKVLLSDIRHNYSLYLIMVPVLAFYAIFCYKPMYGLLMAFQDFSPRLGISGSEWVGLENFRNFFGSIYFAQILRNTVTISVSTIIFGFPAPIILALLINEVKSRHFKKTVQTITYIPYFISLIVICGMIKEFSSMDGVFNDIISFLGGSRSALMDNKNMFVPIYVMSRIWQEVGWGSIIYLAAIAGIDQELYEAAFIDGAGRLRQTWHITISGILPTIIVLLILRLGTILGVGFEQIILLYNPHTMANADVISSFVYRVGLQDHNYGYAAAVGLFNSVINFLLVYIANYISRKANGMSLW